MRHQFSVFFAVLAAFCVLSVEGAPADRDDEEFLRSIDQIIEHALKHSSLTELEEAKRSLSKRCGQSCRNSQLLWRLASCCYYMRDIKDLFSKESTKEERKHLVNEGVEYARLAIENKENDPEAHKWFAVLSGSKGNLGGVSEKLQGGRAFEAHIEQALKLNPNDPHLYFLKGFLQLQTASLKWYEKTVVKAFVTVYTAKEAIENFEIAGELKGTPWKLNSIFLARSYYADGNLKEVKKWLNKANEMEVENHEDRRAVHEIKKLKQVLKIQ